MFFAGLPKDENTGLLIGSMHIRSQLRLVVTFEILFQRKQIHCAFQMLSFSLFNVMNTNMSENLKIYNESILNE